MRRVLRHLPALLGVALLAGAVWVIVHQFRQLSLVAIGTAMAGLQRRHVVTAAAWTVVSYAILTLYDWLGTRYARHRVSYPRVAFASFSAYALAHSLGLNALSGAAIRYRLYAHWGLSPVEIGKIIAFCSLTFTLGALVLGGGILALEPRAIPFAGAALPPLALRAIGAALWAVVVVYLVSAFRGHALRVAGHVISMPGFVMALGQVALATFDVAFTAAILYVLLPHGPNLGYPRFLGVYIAAYSAGLLANLPGGIGVFDTGLLIGLSGFIPPAEIAGAVVVYRLFSYVVPMFIAGGAFAGHALWLRGRAAGAVNRPPPGS